MSLALFEVFSRSVPTPLSLSMELRSLVASKRNPRVLFGLTAGGTLMSFTLSSTQMSLNRTDIDATLQHTLQLLANVSEDITKLQNLHVVSTLSSNFIYKKSHKP